jgi:hypothetical protein
VALQAEKPIECGRHGLVVVHDEHVSHGPDPEKRAPRTSRADCFRRD